jgi:cation:H+ antiporter
MFKDLPLWINVVVFAAAGVVVWRAGTRVASYADAIQKATGIGEALVGMLLLGFITALPELGVTATASHAGNAKLAVNNLLGGMALNVAILATADAAIRREALTSAVATALPMTQGALLVLMLAIVGGATVVGDRAVLGIGLWSWLLLVVYVMSVVVVRRSRGHEGWVRNGSEPAPSPRGDDAPPERGTAGGARRQRGALAPLLGKTAMGAAAILGAGYAIARTGETLAEQTGLGQSFFGAVFLALSTSLPEISIVFSSVRRGNYAMAVSDIFGANLFGLALLFVVDAIYQGEPALAAAGRFATFAALLGIAVTALFIAGLLERRHIMVLRMGVDSLVVIGTYVAGLTVLYTLK